MFAFADPRPFLCSVLDLHFLRFQGPFFALWLIGAFGCLRLCRRAVGPAGPARGGWKVAAVVQVILAFELLLQFRVSLSEAFRVRLGYLKQSDAALNSRSLQAALIGIGLAVVVPSVLVALIRMRRLTTAAKIFWAGVAVSLAGYGLETISLHELDHDFGFLYGLLVAVGALISTSGWVTATLGSRRSAPHKSYPFESRLRRRLARLAVLVVLLLVPEIVGSIEGHRSTGRTAEPRRADETKPASSPAEPGAVREDDPRGSLSPSQHH
jgi:hypothetical protein